MAQEVFTVLEESHKDLHQWFLLHQECVLLFDYPAAALCLKSFRAILEAHLQFENRSVLSNIDSEEGLQWSVHIYQKEHDKILKLLDGIEKVFIRLENLKGRELRLMTLALLDREQSFYHLLEHHEEREEKDLFQNFTGNIPEQDFIRWKEKNASLLASCVQIKNEINEKLQKL